MKTTLNVEVGAIKNALAAVRLDDEPFDALRDEIELEVEIKLDASDVEDIAAEAGYVDADEAHEDARLGMEPRLWDLRDGLAALMAGDRSMATILLARAFDEWPAARTAVEDVIRRGGVAHDPRQLSLVA